MRNIYELKSTYGIQRAITKRSNLTFLILFFLFILKLSNTFQENFYVQKGQANKQQNSSNSSQKNQLTQQDLSFKDFILKMNKNYPTYYQELYRRIIYLKNLQTVKQHNSNPQKTYQMEINHFADMSEQQFLSLYANLEHFQSPKTIFHTTKQIDVQQETVDGKQVIYHNTINIWNNVEIHINFFQRECEKDKIAINNQNSSSLNNNSSSVTPVDIKDVDWTNISGEVHDQGACGACYIFSVLDHISSLYYNKNVSAQFTGLSAQQILDCGYSQIAQGCLGGYLEGSFAYIQINGVTTSKRYPYRSGKSGKQLICASRQGQFKISYFQTLQSGNCLLLKQTLQKKTIPVGIAGYRLQFYKSGIFTDCNDHIDHAVLLVGFDHKKGWKIKNSWGDWGQNGYGWIQDGNKCGICNMAVVATVQQDTTSFYQQKK